MIQMQMNFDVVDNFGVCCVMCIKVFGGLKCKYVFVGDIIVVFVKEVILCGCVKKGDVMKVVVVCIVKDICCVDGLVICFDCNVVVLINNQKELVGICIFGFVFCELCVKNYMKIILFVLEVF